MNTFRAPIWYPSGCRRHCRGKLGSAPQHTQAYRGILYRASKHKIRQGRGQFDRRRARGSGVVPNIALCARIKGGANREISKGKSICGPTVYFLPMRTNKERRKDKHLGAFYRDTQGFGRLDAGSRVGFISSRLPLRRLWTSVPQ